MAELEDTFSDTHKKRVITLPNSFGRGGFKSKYYDVPEPTGLTDQQLLVWKALNYNDFWSLETIVRNLKNHGHELAEEVVAKELKALIGLKLAGVLPEGAYPELRWWRMYPNETPAAARRYTFGDTFSDNHKKMVIKMPQKFRPTDPPVENATPLDELTETQLTVWKGISFNRMMTVAEVVQNLAEHGIVMTPAEVQQTLLELQHLNRTDLLQRKGMWQRL